MPTLKESKIGSYVVNYAFEKSYILQKYTSSNMFNETKIKKKMNDDVVKGRFSFPRLL